MKKHIFYFLALAIVMMVGCQKELSFEGSNSPATGSLQAETTGDCLPKTVNGIYEASKALVPATNTISVQVNVARTGSYIVYTDTVNGYYFRTTGTFTTLGLNTVILRSSGTPFAAGVNNFVVNFDSTVCDIQVTVLPAGAGGPASFTLQGTGTPAVCNSATPTGVYIIGAPLDASNKVTLSVNVTTIGTYSITTTANGMTFSKINGVFLTTGVQNVVLDGSGTPTGTPGVVNFPVTAGTSACGFQLTTAAGAAFSFDCAGATVNGNYKAGVPLDGTNTIDVGVTITSAGPYNIVATINGMTFKASGTFAVGSTNITLTGSGQPVTGGITSNLPIPGTIPCTIPIVVDAGAPPSDLKWQFTQGSTTYGGPTTGAVEASFGGNASVSINGGSTAPTTDYLFLLQMSKPGTMSTGTFSSTSITNSVLFTLVNISTSQTAFSGVFGNGANLTVNITTYDQVTKIIQGTFSGTVKDGSNTTVTITGGTFKAQLM